MLDVDQSDELRDKYENNRDIIYFSIPGSLNGTHNSIELINN